MIILTISVMLILFFFFRYFDLKEKMEEATECEDVFDLNIRILFNFILFLISLFIFFLN